MGNFDSEHKFSTEAEAQAFMLGFHVAASNGIFVNRPNDSAHIQVEFHDTDEWTEEESIAHWDDELAIHITASNPDRLSKPKDPAIVSHFHRRGTIR
jgi:hypothetical protein